MIKFLLNLIGITYEKKETTVDTLIKELINKDRLWVFNQYYAVCYDLNLAVWKANGKGCYYLAHWHKGNVQKICDFNWIDQGKIHKAIKIAAKISVDKLIYAQDTLRKLKDEEKELFELNMKS